MGVVAGAPSHTAYYVALGGVVLLLVMLCCYFFYFCIGRIMELSKDETLMSQYRTPQSSTTQSRTSQLTSQSRSPLTSQSRSALTSSELHPPQALRESAQAMAALCRQHSSH